MIIFISDLHLTDGTFDYAGMVHDTSAGAYEMFWDDILSIVDANRDEGADVRKIQVVLLGDILELRTTTRWVEADVHPWRENPEEFSQDAFAVLGGIVENILFDDPKKRILRKRFCYLSNKHKEHISARSGLRRLLDRGVDISFVLVPGNHDRMILAGKDDRLRDLIKGVLGWEICGPDNLPGFPDEPRFRQQEIGIVANHGHGMDAVDFYREYLQPTVGDLLPEIVGRLMTHARRLDSVGPDEKKDIVKVIQNFDLVRPTCSQFDWLIKKIKSLESAGADARIAAVNRGLQEVLISTFEDLLGNSEMILDFLYPRVEDKANKLIAVGVAAYLLRNPLVLYYLFFKKETAIKKLLVKILKTIIARLRKEPDKLLVYLRDTVNGINRIMPAKREKGSMEEKYALSLLDRANGSFVLFGHTHDYQICPMGVSREGFYFNTGTWKKTVVKNFTTTGESEFQRWARITYVIFFGKGENKDHVFDLWHGNLQFEEDRDL